MFEFSSANIFMVDFENKHIYPLIKSISSFKDILWYGKEYSTSYKPFLKQIYEQHQTIKFDCKISKKETAVLGTTIHLMKIKTN